MLLKLEEGRGKILLDTIDDFFEDLERKRKQAEYIRDADELEAYLAAIKNAMGTFDDGVFHLYNLHQQYADEWTGQTKLAYESIRDEIRVAAFHINDTRDELFQELRNEIGRLREMADALA